MRTRQVPFGRGERTRRSWNAGLLVGLVVGIADGVSVLAENPASFDGVRTRAAFLGASLLLHLGLGVAAGALFVAASYVTRLSPRAFTAFGVAFAFFAWAAIRVHVRWYFGVPLESPASAPAYTGVFLGAGFVCWLASRALCRPIDRALGARMGRTAVGLATVAAALVLWGGWRQTQAEFSARNLSKSDPDVLFLTLDTTRADHLSCYGYPRGTTPALDRIARRGTTYSNAYSSIPLTNPSHVTIFTGLEPREHGVRNNGTAYRGEAKTYVETLQEAGYHCAAFVSGIPLKAGLSGLDRGFSVYDDSFSIFDRMHPMTTSLAALRVANRALPIDLVERRAAKTVVAAQRWLAKSEWPRFLWVHLYDAHSPYDAPAILRARFARESAGWTASGEPVTEWPIADYDAELREVDLHLEDLVRDFELRDADGDDANARHGVVCVTADHGEGLEQHGELTHGQLLYEEDLRVPRIETIVRGSTFTDGSRVESGWVRPEMIDLANFGAPHSFIAMTMREMATPHGDLKIWTDSLVVASRAKPEGYLSETFPPEGREAKAVFVERPPLLLSVKDWFGRDTGWLGRKLIVNYATGETLAFDLATDPGELHPLDTSGEDWAGMKSKIPPPDSSSAATIDPEVKRRLESLGYIH